MAAPVGTAVPDNVVLDDAIAERFVVAEALQPFLADIVKDRTKEIETITRHMEISLNELINRQQFRMADLYEQQGDAESNSPGRGQHQTGRGSPRRTEWPLGAPQERACAGAALHDQ